MGHALLTTKARPSTQHEVMESITSSSSSSSEDRLEMTQEEIIRDAEKG